MHMFVRSIKSITPSISVQEHISNFYTLYLKFRRNLLIERYNIIISIFSIEFKMATSIKDAEL